MMFACYTNKQRNIKSAIKDKDETMTQVEGGAIKDKDEIVTQVEGGGLFGIYPVCDIDKYETSK